jgi:hypothetical protein
MWDEGLKKPLSSYLYCCKMKLIDEIDSYEYKVYSLSESVCITV